MRFHIYKVYDYVIYRDMSMRLRDKSMRFT